MENKGYNDIVNDIKKSGDEIEQAVQKLEAQGMPEHTAYYATMMAFLRRKKK